MAPIKGYFEFDVHPPKIIPYTPRDDIAKIYNIPTFISATTQLSAKGTTAQADKATKQVTIGAITNIILLALFGIIGSFKSNFRKSATGCNNPKGPTILGPFLNCTAAHYYLSPYIPK